MVFQKKGDYGREMRDFNREIVWSFFMRNPSATKTACHKQTGLSYSTVLKACKAIEEGWCPVEGAENAAN